MKHVIEEQKHFSNHHKSNRKLTSIDIFIKNRTCFILVMHDHEDPGLQPVQGWTRSDCPTSVSSTCQCNVSK
ncbi:hypothetical protein LSH36_1385g00013 [Paralvinella palmiformis]|uniref:Uncharacterized protein n=1 Tax=Paralvinella palmiformis TaxID=53620 RepID=A0AAD9MND6_9ANNE|nr:hypothetical protein LSH36_1385g00013 [Paralvinella palmiformis]